MTTATTTPTVTYPPLTALLARSIQESVRIRDTALVDLATADPAQLGSQWAADRMADVTHQNEFIARTAERLGMEPADLIRESVLFEG